MDKDFADIIQRMAREQGKGVLYNGKAKMYLSDYCEGRFKKEANIIRQILDANCGLHINNADNVPERKQKLMKQLEDDNGLSPKVTGEYLDLLGLILKGDTSKCGTSVQSVPTAPSAPTIGKLELDDGTYEGEIVNGIPHGKGKMTYSDDAFLFKGSVYEGDWVDGIWHGKGKIIWADGDVYEGDFIDSLSHGKGKMTYTDGSVYEGDWIDDQPHGKGKYTFADGRVYVGDFVEGELTGKGKMTYLDGKVQEGNWKDGKFVGKSATPSSVPIQPQPAAPPHDSSKKYKIGDRGPAGGIIFYKKWNNSDGWQYLEAAPSDLQNAKWGQGYEDVAGIKTGTGCGKQNTKIIIAALNKKGESGMAAQLCKAYSLNGYNDWFLPSKDELNLLYVNLKMNNLGRFSNDWYWSSSQTNNYNNVIAWAQRFNDGSRNDYNHKGNAFLVRALRAF